MRPFVTAELTVGAILCAVVLLYGVIALRGYRRSVSLPFTLACFFGAVEAFSGPLRYLDGSFPNMIIGTKISPIAVASCSISLAWFAAGYGGDRRRRIQVALSICCFGVIGLHILLPAGLFHTLQIFGNVCELLVVFYLLSIGVRLWRCGEHRRAVSFGLGLTPFFLIACPHGALVDYGMLHLPFLYPFSLLSLVLVMSLSLIDEVLKSDRRAKEIESNERRWRSLLDGVSLMIAGLDTAGRFSYVNPFLAEAMGCQQQDLLGTDFCKLISPKDRDRVTRDLGRALEGELSPQSEFMLRTGSGVDKTISWSNVSLREIDGHVAGILSVGVDMTERVRAEHARDEALKELLDLKHRLETESTYLKLEPDDANDTNIIGQSDAIRYVLHKIKQVAPTDATVLIEGETGVGKELVARALHEGGQRARYPFVTVNCAALAPTLIESELFGHEKGAFTGADRLRRGRFELAEGGTLFLDEIGELSLELQCKLLRVLQEGEYERVGGSNTRKANVRIIAATNRELPRDIAAGRFREDLFYRLRIYPVSIPPLRERRDDIPVLVKHFTSRLADKHGKTIEEIPGHVMRRLAEWDWPGNVRELENVIERAVIITRGRVLAFPGEFAVAHKVTDLSVVANLTTISDMERKHIIRTLNHTHGRIAGEGGAAEILGLHPNTLRSRMAKLRIGHSHSDSNSSPGTASTAASA